MARVDDYALIRIFPDYADSAIWFIIGTVSYEESRVSDGLRQDLKAWEAHYYRALDDDLEWRSREDLEHHAAEGHRLAERLAAEVGADFEVEYFDERDRKVRVRSEHPALNEAAADAFTKVRASHREVFERSLPAADPAPGPGWFANGSDAQPHP